MGDRTAFFYGTLVAPQVLYRVLWGTSQPDSSLRQRLTIKPAILHSYCRHQVAHADYPGIIPQKGKSVLGTYVTGLNDQNIRNLDIFEGGQYRREKVRVRLLEGVKIMELGGTEGEEVEAETYVFIFKKELMDAEWDFHEFVREKLWRWADLSEEYAEVDQSARLDEHDPTGGRSINGDMNGKLAAAKSEEVLESAV